MIFSYIWNWYTFKLLSFRNPITLYEKRKYRKKTFLIHATSIKFFETILFKLALFKSHLTCQNIQISSKPPICGASFESCNIKVVCKENLKKAISQKVGLLGMFIIFSLNNKTRETRVLSRPAICWIHYVQIALSISAKHLSNPQKCSAMLSNAQQCSTRLEILSRP